MDKDRSGVLDLAELKNFMKKHNVNLKSEIIEELV
jgi:hypothetical protein